MVFDAMYTLALGVIKRHLDHYKDQGYLNDPDLDERLSKMPWTAGSCYMYSNINLIALATTYNTL